jgi:hypothetical protein
MDLMAAPDHAIEGWLRYVQLATRHLAPTYPVDERMALALSGEQLPCWLEDGVRIRLVAARGEALVKQVKSRAKAHVG